MPRRKVSQGKRVKVEQPPTLSPLKNRLTDNNETQVEPVINGVDPKSDSGKPDNNVNKYLHKKFKKVATLEETTPTNGKSKGGGGWSGGEESQAEVTRAGSPGRYVCPFCKLACAKPSVLEKHIRAHTNERPYPCRPCGYAFKTKSNLYKHCRSRAHTLKMDETDCEGCSSEEEEELEREEVRTIYKPKFHRASVYAELNPPGPEFLHRHINKLISENQAIVDEPVVGRPKKRRESPPRSPPKNGGSKLALALLRPPDLQPLNLSQRPQPRPYTGVDHVLRIDLDSLDGDSRNPEGSVIKDILLKARSSADGDIPFSCPRCKQSFRTLESFDFHYYCCRESLKRSGPPIKDLCKKPELSPGPHLGNTPLVGYEPCFKKRKILCQEEELSKMSVKPVNLFGGEVHVLDSPGGETKTLRFEVSSKQLGSANIPSYFELSDEEPIVKMRDYSRDPQVLTISKTSLHSGGGTLIQTCGSPESPCIQSYPSSVPPNLTLPTPMIINPLTSITAFNPLTLPPTTALTPIKSSPLKTTPNPYNGGVVTILHGGKSIPFVPGMPGPNTLLATSPLVPLKKLPETPSVIVKGGHEETVQKLDSSTTSVFTSLKLAIPCIRVEGEDLNMKKPCRTPDDLVIKPHFIKKDTILPQVTSSSTDPVEMKKFLRPTSLPLKPGTYTPKRHVSVPNQVSLVSPETPRPRKSYGQLYLNGHAYTYLGLKCSTRMFFCTLNKPQPIYVPLSPEHNKVSMYSNWKVCSDSNPSPLGLEPGAAMAHYDSRNRSSRYTIANGNRQDVITHSTYILKKEHKDSEKSDSSEKTDSGTDGEVPKRIKVCDGGFESNEDYIYVRGRGRGRYVCEECGIRCKKPSMLKKHIRTHTDLRPYTCKHCSFSFKTKGNLTKHMKSKAHNKKCVEMDTSSVPTSIEDSNHDEDGVNRMDCMGGEDSEEDTDDDEDDDDEEETEDEEEGKVRLAAKSLLSLAEVTPQAAHRQFVTAGLVSGRPRTYPYTLSTAGIHHTSREQAVLENVPLLLQEKDVIMRREPSLSESDSSDTKSADLERTQSSTESLVEAAKPIDLSNKSTTGVRTTVINSVGGQASLLATICSTTERLAVTPTADVAEDSQLLHAYLTERAVRDTMMKQQQQQQVQDKQQQHRASPELQPKPVPTEHQPVEINSNAKESALGILALTSSDAKKNCASLPISPNRKLKAEFMPPSTGPSPSYVSVMEDGRSMCGICNKVFNKQSQLRLHLNIHYFERPFRCESCAVSFRTKGHLQKHERALSHLNKVNMNSTFGAATSSNPRPFKCDDCKIAFRIHGHLAKHLRSKMHIMKLECLGKLPFGTYAELERSGMNMNDIDTTDCENSLESLQLLAQKLYEKDPSKLGQWGGGPDMPPQASCGESSSEEEGNGKIDLISLHPPKSQVCHRFEADFEKSNPPEDGVR